MRDDPNGLRPRSKRAGRDQELRRLEEKQQALCEATEKWRTVLRDMERSGESGDAQYETYFRAYIQAKQQEKQCELDLFNRRQGLVR